MIDLEKEEFDMFFNEASQTLNIDRYDAFEVWLERAKLAQAKEQETEAKFNANLVKVEQGIDEMAQGLLMEIESLKAQLSKEQEALKFADSCFKELREVLEKNKAQFVQLEAELLKHQSDDYVLVNKVPSEETKDLINQIIFESVFVETSWGWRAFCTV